MNTTIRRATPDSEAIASSEDERPWPAAPSFGSFPVKEPGVPGLGVGIWSTQKRGSFKMEKTAQRNAAREARLGAPGQPRSGLRNDSTPSPSASEGSAALPFQIPLHPTPKAVRSLSHSQGQREYPPVTGAHSTQPDHAPALPLGLLAEEADTESESELGGALTQTTSHPPIGTLHRTATFPATYDSYYGASNGKEHGDAGVGAHGGSRGDRRFEAAFANLTLSSDQQQRRSQWQTHLGWDDVPNVNESRRHSLADIPTRRGSLVGGIEQRSLGGGQYWPDTHAYDWEEGNNAYGDHQFRDTASHLEIANRAASGTPDEDMLSRQFAALYRGDHLPKSYRVNPITLPENERNGGSEFNTADTMGSKSGGGQAYGGPSAGNRPRRQLYIVSFKCSRADVFYLLDNTGLHIRDGDIVIVEADRGQDLGTVQHSNVTQEEARHYLRRYKEEQYKWLMMFSKNNNKNSVNPNAQVYSGDRSSAASNNPAPASYAMGMRENANLKPKAIKRLANQHEIHMLADKEGNEAKAKRTCQNKVSTLHLEMEILDAEWQWDFQKLIFYYYADHYINFKDLVTELYRIYKTRIWMGAINPASYSQHAISSPPDGIGPGALTGAARAAYYSNLAAGVDPDPYGAVPPYQVGYTTYNPNYPAIPGVVNSFANPMSMPFTPMMNQVAETSQGNDTTPYGSGNATPSGSMPGMSQMPFNAPGNMYGSGEGAMAAGMPATNSIQVPGASNMQMPSMSGPWPSYGGYSSYGGFNNYGSYGGGQGFQPPNTATSSRRPSDPIAIPRNPSRGRGGPTSSGEAWLNDPANFRTARPPGVRPGRYDFLNDGAPPRAPPTSSAAAAQQSSTQATAVGASQHNRLGTLPELSGKAGLMNQFLDSLPPEEEDRADLRRAASENW